MAGSRVSTKHHWIAVAALVWFTIAIFGQSVAFPYIALDDPFYVAQNLHIQDHLSLRVLWWSVSDIVVANWHPATMLSYALTAASFGLTAGPQHAVNVVLHGLNGCLLYGFLWRCTRAYWPSLFVALIFAIHPLRVETVAWVSDRKGVLSGFFVLVTLLCYERYVARRDRRWYAAVAAFFALALLSKPTAVVLPFGMLLLDFWPLARMGDADESRGRRLARLSLEKAPLILLCAASSVATFLAQRSGGAVKDTMRYSVGVRLANAVESYVMYAADTLAPFHLAPQYPHPGTGVFGAMLYVSIIVFSGLTILAIVSWKRRPWVGVGWFWFCSMLVPAIGLIQVADQARADRYTYLPQIGLLMAVAWSLDELMGRFPRARGTVFGAAALWGLVLSVEAFMQTSLWRDDFTLFSYTVARAPNSSIAQYFLGSEYMRRNDAENAERHLRASTVCTPPIPEAFNNLAVIELRRGDTAHAAEHFANALALDPENTTWMVNYGVTLYDLGRRDEAEALAERVLQRTPGHARALSLQALCRAPARPK